jgi:hypothetical protein
VSGRFKALQRLKEGGSKVEETNRAGHYFKRSARHFGTLVAEVDYSIGARWDKYGTIPLCAGCKRSCKVAGARGINRFYCGDFLEKD